MNDSRTIVDRSRRHYAAETAAQTVRLPGQSIGHFDGGSMIRIAYCKTNAESGNTIVCYLDENKTEINNPTEVTVYCSICNGIDLNSAIPRLAISDWIIVAYIANQWRCLSLFNGSQDCDTET